MEQRDRMLLDRIQRAFPLVPEPFRSIGKQLTMDEGEVRLRIAQLKKRKILRQISAIFNTAAIGYRSSLVAMAVPPREIERVAQVINMYPGVSHNYLRPASFNMWFTIAVPPHETLEQVVTALADDAGGYPFLILPALKKYKLAVVLDVLEEADYDTAWPSEPRQETLIEARGPFIPSDEHVRIVRCVQEDIPVVPKPFHQWAASLGISEEHLLGTLKTWRDGGIIRRFAAILNHREAGFLANAMVVWRCPEAHLDDAGRRLASFPDVSHCYHRPAHPQWPYNLYAMIHGKTQEECHRSAQELARAIGVLDYALLFIIRELKKVRLKLFWREPN